jgi:hypothetical protein
VFTGAVPNTSISQILLTFRFWTFDKMLNFGKLEPKSNNLAILSNT